MGLTPEEFQDKYLLATGVEIDAETAKRLLDNPSIIKSFMIKKIIKMAEPTRWADLAGTYTQINPLDHEGMK